MKKITLLVASIFLVGSVANASELINFSDDRRFPVSINNAEPIVFVERGVEFYVFADGQFDFNTRPSKGDLYYKNGRRSVNKTFGAPANNRNFGVKIEHDNLGRIRRVGNVFVNYDANDRIKRIGSVYMSYNRFALSQVGGLKIVYNRRGQIIDFVGAVKGYSYNNDHQDDNYYGNQQQNNGGNNNDDDYYYYRTDGSKAKIEDDKKRK